MLLQRHGWDIHAVSHPSGYAASWSRGGPVTDAPGRGDGPQTADQLPAARGDGRRDAGRDGAVPAGGHAAAGEFGGARARAGLLLGVRPVVAGDLPRRGLRSRHQGTLPGLRVALGEMRILREPALGEGQGAWAER